MESSAESLTDAGAATQRKTAREWPLRDSVLDDFLRRINLLGHFVRGLTGLGWTVVGLIVFAVVAILSDAAFAWSPAVRIALIAVAASALVAAVMLLIRQILKHRYEPRRAARLAEMRMGRRDSVLVNAVEFRSGAGQGSDLLQSRVMSMADECLNQTSCSEVVPVRPAFRAAGMAFAASVAFLVAVFLAPKLFGMVLPRYFDPLGDHPPYTLLDFIVSITPEPVYHSRPATITVKVSGPDAVNQAEIVFVDSQGKRDAELGAIPAFRSDDQTFVVEIARAERSSQFYVDTPQGRSPRFDFTVTEIPFLEEATARVDSPEYTQWKPRQQKLDQRGLRGMVGARVFITARSNLPLESGRMDLVPARSGNPTDSQATPDSVTIRLKPRPDDPHVVEGEFPIAFNGRFELRLHAASGADSLEALSGPITAMPDRGPQVVIASPDRTLVAVEGWQVPVVVEATDDVQVARMRLFRGVNGWSPVPVEIPRETLSANQVRGRYKFDLQALGAQAGDMISYYAAVEDNDPVHPHAADSPIHTIQVISQEEYKEFARQQYQIGELAEEFTTFRKNLDRLAEERQAALEELEQLRKKAEEGPLSTEDQQQAEQLEQQLREFAEGADSLKKKLEERAKQLQLYEMEKEYTEELQKLSKALESQSANASEVAQQLEKLRSGELSAEQREQFEQAAEKFAKENEPFEKESLDQQQAAADDLELMQKANALLAQTDRLRAVIAQQRDLSNRLAELAGKEQLSADEQSRAERFAKEQELLDQELQSLQKDLLAAADAASERLPKMSESAHQLASKIDELTISEDQLSAATAARAGNGDEAHRRAESAARKLESLQGQAGQCEQCQGLEEGLDGPLRLSRERLAKNLKQMSQGRKVPGLGQQRGQGRTPGEGGQQGEGQSQGGGQSQDGSGLWKPGQSFPGSQANSQVAGPLTEKLAEADGKDATMQSDGHGQFTDAADSAPLSDQETVNPQTRTNSGSSTGNLRGVPIGYRDAAEAYFRRLAEERKSK